jgi:hypothetical protein
MTEDKTIYTRLLSVGEVEAVINGLPDLLWSLAGDCILTAEYGTECNIHNDLQYVPMQVGIRWVDRFLAESREHGIFVPAKSDLSITTPNGGLTILLCHESDIHVTGTDETLIERACQSDLLRPLLKP